MSLFSLDILEPSLVKPPTQSPTIPLQGLSSSTTEASLGSSKQTRQLNEPCPPRWNTPEFWFYGFAFVTVVPMMVYCAYDVSRGISTRVTLLTEKNRIQITRNMSTYYRLDGFLDVKSYVYMFYTF